MANLITNVNQACADLTNIKKAITDKGVEIASGTPSSEYADKVNEVYDAGKAYAYDNPQTPTDDRWGMKYWYEYLSDGRWDTYMDEDYNVVYPSDDPSTWYDSVQYPKGTQNVTSFEEFTHIHYYNEMYYSNEIMSLPTRKFIGTLDMSSCLKANSAFSMCNFATDLGTIILPTSTEVKLVTMFSWATSVTTVRFIGEIKWNMSFANSPLDGDTIRHIVSILSDNVTGKTLTLSKNAVEAVMPWEDWDELISTKLNWTISLI